MKTTILIGSLALGILAFSGQANAIVVYLDLGSSAGSEGGNWNTVSAADANGADITGLVDWNTGETVPWSIEMGAISWAETSYTGWDTGTAGNWAGAATGNDALLLDTKSGFTLRFYDVLPDATYTVEIISYLSGGEFFEMAKPTIIVVGDLGNSAAEGDAKGLGSDGTDHDPSLATSNGNWLIYNDTKAGGGAGPGDPGEFSVNFSFQAFGINDLLSKEHVINAIRITQVPEPSAALLLGVGVMRFIFRRRKSI